MNLKALIHTLDCDDLSALSALYGKNFAARRSAWKNAAAAFERLYGGMIAPDAEVMLLSAPGRSEIGGNHTDHQHGRVLAASIDLEVIAVCAATDGNVLHLQSRGHDENIVDLSVTEPVESERFVSNSLIRGVAAGLRNKGYRTGAFCAYTDSEVLRGSGLSSSAAFEIVVGSAFSHLFNDGRVTPVELAQIGQYAENAYFGKPSGLMDQTACAVGGFVAIDFADPAAPVLEKIDCSPADLGYELCIIDTHASHADLNDDYAAIPQEMRSVAACFDREVLRGITREDIISRFAELRKRCGDRAVLRALHFIRENDRAAEEAAALRAKDFDRFLALVNESGLSSETMLQNIHTGRNTREEPVAAALALARALLGGKGAVRVHGGGFAGTIQAFVPLALSDSFSAAIDAALGENSCRRLSVRSFGTVRLL